MFETNRDPFESLREQWGTAQELAVGTFQKAQERADIREGIEREEARYQQQRTDALSAEARRTALEQLSQLDAALAQLDPEDPEDAQAYEEGIRARNYLTGVLGQTGQNALSAIAEGRVMGDGRLVPVGEAVAAAGARGRAAGERRAEEAREREFQREREMNMLGFTFESRERALDRDLTREEGAAQREFEALMAAAERDLRRGLTTQQIAAQLHEQFVSLGFQGDQAALDRALQLEIEQGRIDLETKRLSMTESAALGAQFISQIQSLDPNREADRVAMSALLEDARASGLTPGWLSAVEAQVEAQAGAGAQLGFQRTEAEIDDIRAAAEARRSGVEVDQAQIALLGAQESYTLRQIQSMDVADAETRARTGVMTYDLERKKVVDGRADIIEFQDFVVSTTALGSLGLPALQQMLFDIENGVEDSIYAPYMDFVTPEMLEAAIEKATQIGSDEDTARKLWLQQTRGALADGDLDNIARVASFMDPQEITAMLEASDDDPMFTNEETGATMRYLRDTLRGNPAMAAAAARQAGIRALSENQPRIASATSRLEFYAAQRPDDIAAGEAAVRGALQVLADNGLLGDPLDPDATAEIIEQHVSFYRQAWGDQEGAFNAEMAESAARTALNRANAIAASRTLNDGPEGVNLEALKFLRDTTDRQIDAVQARMDAVGCNISDMAGRASALQAAGLPRNACETMSQEVAAYEQQYLDLLNNAGYLNPAQQVQSAIRRGIAEQVEQDMPDATSEEKNAEVARRYDAYLNPPPPPGETEEGEEPREPMTAAERGAAAGSAVRGAAQAIGPGLAGAATAGVNAITGFVGGALGGAPAPAPQVTFDNPGLQQLDAMPYTQGGRQTTVGEAWRASVNDPTTRVAILEYVQRTAGIDRQTATEALNQLITGR